MIIDADVTVQCDICKDEMAWLAVFIQAVNGKLLASDIDAAVKEAGWTSIALGMYKCRGCQMNTDPLTIEQPFVNLRDRWEDLCRVIIHDTTFGQFLVGTCEGINNILERIVP